MDIDDIIGEQGEDEKTGSDNEEQKEIPPMTGDTEESEESIENDDDTDENKIYKSKVLVGRVERYFSNINVVAITLLDPLKIGDVIEIDNEGEPIRLTVSSMQINREEVAEATKGDDVGIKVDEPVKEGSGVYKINE